MLFRGVGNAQGFLLNVVVFSETIVTNGFNLRCSLLGNDKFVKLGQCEEPWFCLECMTNNLPFYALDGKKVYQLEHQFDVIALTETWHMKTNVNFTPGILSEYQNMKD